jgi:hypothetical protein
VVANAAIVIYLVWHVRSKRRPELRPAATNLRSS